MAQGKGKAAVGSWLESWVHYRRNRLRVTSKGPWS